ncbi:multidrug efflux SMR transporter [Spiractinospora alimapuensis]|uniref:DMT family transporter n=1 Tax=Spiractinospora alimapuensis TaxID=2820884 RepID=UPI001F3112CB|nr:multidrug efflux SMR transporter [Spiractinospora alimapuensis]QVQ53183.1 multidrug efflux SMR transporter [Spiractinospora alimapuensis]
MPWILLGFAIVLEVIATTFLKLSHGFTRLGPSIVVVVGYLGTFYLLSLALRDLPLGVAYGVWAAFGVALVAIVGAVFLGEGMTWIQVMGIVLVVAGVVALEMGGNH